MRLQEAARTSAFVLKFGAEKPRDPGPWAVSPLKLPSFSENTSQSVLFPVSFIGEDGRNGSALLFPAHSLQEVRLHQNQDTRVPMEWVGFSAQNGPRSDT